MRDRVSVGVNAPVHRVKLPGYKPAISGQLLKACAGLGQPLQQKQGPVCVGGVAGGTVAS